MSLPTIRSIFVSVILLAAAVWLTVGSPPSLGEGENSSVGIVSSERERSISSRVARSAKGGGLQSDLERLKLRMREFSEDELAQMIRAEPPAADLESARRLYAMWERLGELKSELGMEILLEQVALTSPIPPETMLLDPTFRDHGANASIGGWAASLDSLEEIQQEPSSQLLKLKQAGIRKHEFALGREMARFDPVVFWNILAASQTADMPLAGRDGALHGFVRGMAGNPEIS